MTELEQLSENFQQVHDNIDRACQHAGRDPSEVRLLPVTKTVPVERLRLAYRLGYRVFGENKVQEARNKAEAMADCEDLHWSVIGHLQTNKAKYVARFASEFQALDNLRTARALHHRLTLEERALDVLVQVNTSGEDSKYGLQPEQVEEFLSHLPDYPSLRVKGLMTLAVFSKNPETVRPCFRTLRTLRDRLRTTVDESMRLDTLSMGMSGDYELAIQEGATVVRVGQAIFGARPLPDSHYWPGTTQQ